MSRLGPALRIQAELHATDGGDVLPRVRSDGHPDSILQVVDDLTVEGTRNVSRPVPRG